ncbi:glycosyl transferase family 1 [Sulfuricella sp. T08]|uniref:glycosyltransferase family 4 protein n=1 Tax=Sulfuricella sp. T08 TaxID=1632857 RepID=UPI0006179B1B|nr:glycosyltransferase [Sulfuricella sp. T08]GAO34785.1 glycosyl transferase family 1 [Sulfuricella sp. T08]
MKRVALVTQNLSFDGGVKTVVAFLRDVIRSSDRYDAKIISLASSSSDSNSCRLFSPGTWFSGASVTEHDWPPDEYFHVGANFSEFEFQRYKPRRILSALLADCDVIQVVSGSPALGLAVSGLGKPVVLQVATRATVERRMQEIQGRGFAAAWRRRMTKITDKLDDCAIRQADAVMVENPWMMEYCQGVANGYGTQIKYAPPGIDTGVFSPSPSGRVLSENSPYILSVGRMQDPRKNIGLLLDAYRLLTYRMQDAPRLVLAGATPPPDKFWKCAKDYGLNSKIDFVHGPTFPELIRLYQEATCFALPSDEEGFGMVVIESMGCAVPVVSTRSGGPDGIIDDGVDGYLVPLGDAQILADRLQRLCSEPDLNVRMGNLARKKVENEYDISVAGARFLETYDELVFKY